MTVTIRRDADPFKKYWWVLLIGFGLVGAWICFPLLGSGGTAPVVRDQGLKSADQSLDALNNPAGAPGSATDLSMGAYRKKSQTTMKSSLYEAPPETAAAGTPVAAGAGENLADALKDISRHSASTDAGSWGEKAQKGFEAPHANFGSLSGVGGGGSGSSASGGSSYVVGGGGGAGAFGTAGPKTGMTATRGLGSDSARAKGGGSGTMKALENAASQSAAAANQKSFDASAAGGGKNFDGSNASGQLSGPGGAALGGAGYASLDAAPANLKVNDPKGNKKDIQPPPAKPVATPPTSMADQIKMMIIMMAIGGVMNMAMGGISGAMMGKG